MKREKREIEIFPSVGGNYWRKVARLQRAGYTTRTRKTRSIFLAYNAHPKAKGGRTLQLGRLMLLTASCLDRILDAAGSSTLLIRGGEWRGEETELVQEPGCGFLNAQLSRAPSFQIPAPLGTSSKSSGWLSLLVRIKIKFPASVE